ncbi:hypothetical protein AAFN90_18495 [Erwiniaceae bacterium CAU 1747]
MRIILSAVILFAAASASAADDRQTEASYITHLCKVVVQKPEASADFYLEKIKEMSLRGESSPVPNQEPFDQEIAEEAVNSWLSLSPEQRQQAKSAEGCQQLMASEFQQAD